MIDTYVNDIKRSLSNRLYYPALSLALTLPDICGKAKYPNKKTSFRYIKWYDEYLGQYEHPQWDDDSPELPYLSGELVYSLRCALLHEGNPSVDKQKMDLIHFELMWNPGDNSIMGLNGSMAEAEIIEENGKQKAINRRYCVNVRDLCFKLCACAGAYYKCHKEEFDFFDYSIVNMNFHTRQIFRVDQP